jgi:hypothetical protein
MASVLPQLFVDWINSRVWRLQDDRKKHADVFIYKV